MTALAPTASDARTDRDPAWAIAQAVTAVAEGGNRNPDLLRNLGERNILRDEPTDFQRFASELVGTALLVFIGAG